MASYRYYYLLLLRAERLGSTLPIDPESFRISY
jgi:hypothetical protein